MKKRVFTLPEQAQLDVKSRVKHMCGEPGSGVRLLQIFHYQRFAGQVQAAQRKFDGEVLLLAAATQLCRYMTVYNLQEEMLLRILREEFAIELPGFEL